MKEYLPKNPNEYMLDGKRYLKKVCRCDCTERQEGAYILDCRIHQRGRQTAKYVPGEGCIRKWFTDQRMFFLADNALHTVEAAVEAYKSRVEETKEWSAVRVCDGDSAIEIRYQVKGDNVACFLASGRDETRTERFYEGYDPIHRMLFRAADLLYEGNEEANRKKIDAVQHSSRETIRNNPIYAAAITQGEELFAKLLKLHYGITDRLEEACLSKCFGWKILPQLPEAFDKDYYIEAGTINEDDDLLLRHSGYRILHRPYFSMKGSTHKAFTLNPHIKSGVDAAPVGKTAISFQDYLKLFEDNNQATEENGDGTIH